MANQEQQPNFFEAPDQDSKAEKKLTGFITANFGIAIGDPFTSVTTESKLLPVSAENASSHYGYSLSLEEDLTQAERLYHIIHAGSHYAIGDLLNPAVKGIGEIALSQRNNYSAMHYDKETDERHRTALAMTDSLIKALGGDQSSTLRRYLMRRTPDVWKNTLLPKLATLSMIINSDEFFSHRQGLLRKLEQEKAALPHQHDH